MKALTHHFIRVRLEIAVIAFFIFVALSLLMVYLAAPAIYAHSLPLTSSSTDRYPVPVTLFLVGILAGIAFLILGVVRHWRWLFWGMLVAFAGSALHIPVTLLQMTGVLPSSDPLWYGLFQMGVAVVALALAVWMIHIYRYEGGVWAQGAKRNER
jgi:hypothetical protein